MDTELIKKFVEAYNSAEVSIDENDAKTAKEKYQKLLRIYNQINSSDLDHTHKELAYDQLMKIHSAIKGIRTRSSFAKPIMITAVLIILVSVIIVAKPSIIGLAAFAGNQAPEWTHETTSFDIGRDAYFNLNDYFTDPDGDELNFMVTHVSEYIVALRGSVVHLQAESAVSGQKQTTFMASDGKELTKVDITLNICEF